MTHLLSAIAPYVPPALIQSVLLDPTFTDAPVLERHQAAVLFVDVSGFTPLTEALAQSGAEGPEELRTLLNRYFTAMIALTEAEGGGVVKFSGDAMSVLFLAQDEPLGFAVRRAKQAAAAMQAAMVDFAELQTSAGVVTLGMKISIGVGDVLAMQVGGVFDRWEYVIAGDPLRQVGEAEHRASRGDIILSPEAEAVLHPTFLVPQPLQKPDWANVSNAAAVEKNLRRFVPGPALGWLEEKLSDWLPVLRPISVVFVAVKGLQYDQPNIAERLHAFLRVAQQTLYRYEGTLRQLVVDDKGTVLMALFGAPPFAHEDDPERALLCALHLQRVVKELDLHLAIGVATGHVFSGPVGGETRFEYTAMGDTVNLAARLMGKAGVGNVLCEFETYRQAKHALRFETLSPIRVKGKVGLLRVYWPLGKVNSMTRVTGSRETTIVGRAAELQRIEAAFDVVAAGKSRILLIEGEAGIGKTRLVTELMRVTKERGWVWLIGAGQSIERQTPYRAWRDVLMFYFGLEESADPEESRARVRAVVEDLAPEQAIRLPLLDDIINLGFPDNDLTQSLDPELRQQGLVALLLALLRVWTRERPLVVILEDAHWLDSLSWALTVEIARAFVASNDPLLLVIVTRPLMPDNVGFFYIQTLRELPVIEDLELSPLLPADTMALVADRLGLPQDALPESVVNLVRRWAEGNPFFAEELIFALQDHDILHVVVEADGEKQCQIKGNLLESAQKLPDTIHGLVLGRIDRQPPERQLVLKTAAVIGRTFDYASLCYVYGQQMAVSDRALKSHLDALAQLELTPLLSPEPDLTYAFKHIITQEVAYETLLFAQRRALHRTVAEWYESQAEKEAQRDGHMQDAEPSGELPTLTRYLPLLVYHYRHAGLPDKERHYAQLAGAQAAAQFANTEAVRYFTRALLLTPDSELVHRYPLLLARERVYALQGDYAAQQHDLVALEALTSVLGVPQWQAEVALRHARYAVATGDYASAVRDAQHAIELAQMLGDVNIEAAGALQFGRALWLQGEAEAAVPQLERALLLARDADLGQVEAESVRSLGVIAYYQGNQSGGTACFEQALAIFQKIGDRRGEGGALNNLGVAFFNQGDYVQARDYYQQGLHIYREVGYRQGEGRAIGNLGIIAHHLGDYTGAQTQYEHALEIYHEVGYRQGVSTLLSYMSLLFHHLDDQAAALTYGKRAYKLAQELDDSLSQGFALTNIGHASAAMAQWADAAQAYRQAVEVRREAGQPNLAIESLAGLAKVQYAQQARTEALTAVEEILAHLKFNSLDGTIEPFSVYWRCYRILRACDDPRAAPLLARARTLLEARAKTITDVSSRRSFVENVAVHREILQEAVKLQAS